MSGHSKWSSIKHRKAASDAKRGQAFTKLGRAITVAAKDGGGDPEANPALSNAIQKAKDIRMPNKNIERAIMRGTGEGTDEGTIESASYEGYGPGGVALLVDALTDNKNRTAAEVRNIFTSNNSNLGEPGSVSWIFEKKGVVMVDAARYGEDDLIEAIDAGAEDVALEDDSFRITCDPASLSAIREVLDRGGIEVESSDISMEPANTVEVTGDDAKRLLKMMDALEEHDDVSKVHANFDIAADVLEGAISDS